MPTAKTKTVVKKVTSKLPVGEEVAVTKDKVAKKTELNLSVAMYSMLGEEKGSLKLSERIFAGKINKPLTAQAMRIYLNNQKAHNSHTKTRAEVQGSTRKIQAQKGTGHARHGSIRAPIFVHGGIALGPKYRKTILDLPKKMMAAALVSTLSQKAKDAEVFGLEGLEKVSGKTSELATLLAKIAKRNPLIVVESKNDKLQMAARNLPKVSVRVFDQLNPYEVVRHRTLFITSEAVAKLEGKIVGSALQESK